MGDHIAGAAIDFLRDLAAEAAADEVIDLQWGMALSTMLMDGWLVLRPGHYPDAGLADVSHVNGLGQRCGCGAPSRLHLKAKTNGLDYFLCGQCALRAVIGYVAVMEQPRFGDAVESEYTGAAR